MTVIENLNPRIQYQGPIAINDALSINFPYTNTEDVKCVVNNEQLVYNRDYTVLEQTLTIKIAIPQGQTITIYRSTPLDQQAEFPQNNKFNSEKMNEALDKICMQQQEQVEESRRSVRVPISVINFDGQLPIPIPGRSLKINDDGTSFILTEYDSDRAYDATEQFRKEAQQARNEATTQAGIATTQARNAATSAAQAKTAQQETQSILETATNTISAEEASALNAIASNRSKALTDIQTNQQSAITAIGNSKNTAVNAVVTQQNTAVNAVVTQQNTSVNTVNALGQNYVNKCKDWATSDNVVEDGLRSAKYYAEHAQSLSGITYEQLRSSNAYENNGTLLTDEEGYADILKMKHDNFDKEKFTIVGSPTITEDGMASGFSASNYITSNYNLVNNKTYTFVVEGIGGTPSTDRGKYVFVAYYNSGGNDNLRLITGANDGIVRFALGTGLSDVYTTLAILDGVKYKIKLKTDFKSFVTFTDLLTGYTLTKTGYNITNQIYGDNVIHYGTNQGSAPLTGGSINLSSISITADGKEVFTGAKTGIDTVEGIEILYTISKTGAKIVSAEYRNRVIELYEKTGQANYYTLDTGEVPNFTLPMGNIYGLIRQNRDTLDTKVNVSDMVVPPFVSYNNITNCILEAPHRINIELNNGVLTLKKGSVVIVPNGAGKFDERTITSDISYPLLTHTTCNRIVFLNTQNNTLNGFADTACFSGTSQPETTFTTYIWYDTTNNVVKSVNNGSWTTRLSLPICIGNYVNGSGFSSIDQVFNGIGYIGSTIWRENIKYLISNGKNTDGTLNNIEVTTTNILTYTIASTVNTGGNGRILLNADGGFFARIGSYDAENNYVLGADGVERLIGCVIADNCTITNGVIKQMKFKYPFRAVDYYDFQQLSDEVDTKVNRAGDTMSGNLIIEKAQGSFAIRDPNLDFTTSPAANSIPAFRCIDKNNNTLGDVRFERRTDGSQRTTMLARNKRNGTQVDASITVAIGATGIRSCAINGQSLDAFVTGYTVSGQTWKRTWSDGRIEQGGFSAGDGWRPITFATAYTSYWRPVTLIEYTKTRNGDQCVNIDPTSITLTGFSASAYGAGSNANEGILWAVEGY